MMLVTRTVVSVEGAVLNQSSVRVENRTDAIGRITAGLWTTSSEVEAGTD
jgi:hypothetical protein